MNSANLLIFVCVLINSIMICDIGVVNNYHSSKDYRLPDTC